MTHITRPPDPAEAPRPLDALLREQCPDLDRVRITPQHTRDLAGQAMDWHHVELLDARDRQIVGPARVRWGGRREVLRLLMDHHRSAPWSCALEYRLGRGGRPGELEPQLIVMGCPVASCGAEIGVPSTALRVTDGCPAGVCPDAEAPTPCPAAPPVPRWGVVTAHTWEVDRHPDWIRVHGDRAQARRVQAACNRAVTDADLDAGRVALLMREGPDGWRVADDPRLSWARTGRPEGDA